MMSNEYIMSNEDNLLIALFMGAKIIEYYSDHVLLDFVDVYTDNKLERGSGYPDNYKRYHSSNCLKYHLSWDWIMKVVDKIQNDINEKKLNYTFINDIKLKTTYESVIEFIKWYNLNIQLKNNN